MIKYGLPYRGSKNRLADDIISVLPSAPYLYDLFAGGCAITHAALLSGKWGKVFANDLQDAPRLFCDAVAGKYRNEKRWVSREEFHAEKENNPFIRWVWSFGNNGSSYLFGRDVEPVKKAAHEYLFNNGYDGTVTTRKKLIAQFKKDVGIKKCFDLEQLGRLERLQQLQQLEQLQQLQQLERLQQLQQLQRLERLQQLERLQRLQRLQQRLTISALDYRKVKIKPGAVIYCDPPYPQKRGQKEKYYGLEFDTPAFYDWVRSNKNPVYFSSVFAPRGFKVVFEKKSVCRMNNKGSAGKKDIIERVYWNGVK